MPPRPKTAAAAKAAAAASAPPVDPAAGAPLSPSDDDGTPPTGEEVEPAAETCPFDPALQPGEWTKWQHDREPQALVLVPARNVKERGALVCLARVNGVAYWAARGVQKYVPESVARIAFEAELSVLPVDGAVTPTFVGQQPPALSGAPTEAAGG